MKHTGGWIRKTWRYIYTSQWFHLRQDEVTLPNGDEITYTLVDNTDYVLVVPVGEDGRVVMEHIYRYTLQQTLLECSAGGLSGDEPAVAARRELEEETGYRTQQLTHLGRFAGTSGISNEQFDVYLATGLTADGHMERENTEQIEIELIPLSELRTKALRGEIQHAPSALAILLAWEKLQMK